MFEIKVPQALEASLRFPDPIMVHVVHRNHYLITMSMGETNELIVSREKYNADVVPNVEVRWTDGGGLTFTRGDFVLFLFLEKIFTRRVL